jgi:hypothetical protein
MSEDLTKQNMADINQAFDTKSPESRIQACRRIYERTNKDMSWPEFLKAFMGATSTELMHRDLTEVIRDKHVKQTQAVLEKERIDKAIKDNGIIA